MIMAAEFWYSSGFIIRAWDHSKVGTYPPFTLAKWNHTTCLIETDGLRCDFRNGTTKHTAYLMTRLKTSTPKSSGGSIRVGKRTLSVSNLDKVLYPAGKFIKAQVIDYYSRVSPYLLPHFKNRPVTLVRFPGGVFGESF